MNLRANAETKFLLKYLIIGIACLAFAGWSAYDGFITFPNQFPRAKAWDALLHRIEDSEILSDQDIAPMWREIAKTNGWNSDRLEKSETVKAIKGKIAYNYLFIGIGLVVGIPCIIWYLRNKASWIESTSDGIRSSRGAEFKISQVTKFDKKKWEKKGIGVVHYQDESKGESKFIIDDLKHDRVTTDKIVMWMESQIPDKLIVNGETELVTQKKLKAAAKAKAEALGE